MNDAHPTIMLSLFMSVDLFAKVKIEIANLLTYC